MTPISARTQTSRLRLQRDDHRALVSRARLLSVHVQTVKSLTVSLSCLVLARC